MTDAPTPPRKRARRASATDSDAASVPREKILGTAAQLIRQKGYRATTVRDIAEGVGILSGSLFHHFASKEEMLLEIMREAFLSVCMTFEKAMADEADPSVLLRQLIRIEMDAVVNHPRKDFQAVLYFDWREVPPAALPELNRYRARYRRPWVQTLNACAAAGCLRCEPDIAEQVIHGTLRHVMRWFKRTGPYSTDVFGDQLAGLVLQAPKPGP
jgi:TetR/AcrR family transcriptional regulator, cholesterol catabolism regulator